MNLQRNFLILAALAAAAATPAFGQAVTPAAGTVGGATQDTASIPDFSGTWGHFSYPGLEPPLSGPGPVVNKSRRRQAFDDNGLPFADATAAPLVSNNAQRVGDYTNPILKPWAAQAVKKHG